MSGELLTGSDRSVWVIPTAGSGLSIIANGTTHEYSLISPVSISLGGTSATSFTNHGLLVGSGDLAIRTIPVGSTNTVLLGNTGGDPLFGAVPNSALANSSITLTNGNNISFSSGSVSLGGSIIANINGTTNRAVQVGNASGSLTSLGLATNGQILIGSTGANPVFGSVTSSNSSIIFTGGAGTLDATVAAATTSQAGVATFATTAEVTTGTSTTKFPSVASIIGHEGVVKGWVKFNSSGVIQDSYNVSSVSKGSTGVFTINWATAFANANYCIQVSALTSGPITQNVTAQSASACTVQYTGGSVTLLSVLVILAGAVDPTMGYVLAIGDR